MKIEPRSVPVRALTGAALALDGVERVEIHCDEANTRSAAVAQRCGYRLDRVVDDEVTAPGEVGREMVWVSQAHGSHAVGGAGRVGQ